MGLQVWKVEGMKYLFGAIPYLVVKRSSMVNGKRKIIKKVLIGKNYNYLWDIGVIRAGDMIKA